MKMDSATRPVLGCEGLTIGFAATDSDHRGETILFQNLDFEAGPQTATLVEGESGTGKTSLLAVLTLLRRPLAGRVYLEGREISGASERFRDRVRLEKLGVVHQHHYLIEGLSVMENLLLPLLPTGQSLAGPRRRAQELLGRMGLGKLEGKPAGLLSGGERQRVAVARALMRKPAMVVADEPTAHLDDRWAKVVLDCLFEASAAGAALIVATHDQRVARDPRVDRRLAISGTSLEEVEAHA